jgi:hypothetical protein
VQVLPWADLDRRDAFKSCVGLGILERRTFSKELKIAEGLFEPSSSLDWEPQLRRSIDSIRWIMFGD